MSDENYGQLVDLKRTFLLAWNHNRNVPPQERLSELKGRMRTAAKLPSYTEVERRGLLYFINRELKRYEHVDQTPASG